MSTYTGHVPEDINIDPRIIPFFEAFYATSDNPAESSHDDYADAMTSDGTLIMGTKKCVGRDQIFALRKGLWSGPVKTRYVGRTSSLPFTICTIDSILLSTTCHVPFAQLITSHTFISINAIQPDTIRY